MGCICDAKNPTVTDLSKHVYLKYKFLVDQTRKGSINIHYVFANYLIADLLTNNFKRSSSIKW